MIDLVIWILLIACLVIGDLRWLRVAQREHYAPGRVTAMAWMWSRLLPWNAVVWLIGAVLVVAGLWLPVLAIPGLLALTGWPVGLGIVGRTARLAWTARLKRLTAAVLTLQIGVVLIAWQAQRAALAGVALLGLIEFAVWAMAKLENALSDKYVVQAQGRLRRVAPRVVAITGSYGKTSTKLYTVHLLAGSFVAVASPASFNNRLGLARAVNDRLAPGTEIFIAEMGTYGPGEITELCRLFRPEVAAITTIGEAHLERMGDRATIVRAKSEIVADARAAVLNVDVPELAELAERIANEKSVLRCSTGADDNADVVVRTNEDNWAIQVAGEPLAEIAAPISGHPINLAIAIGIGLCLGMTTDQIRLRLTGLPAASHRAEVRQDSRGVWIIDDTYNSNPIGASQALATARRQAGAGGRVFVITPGMVELGVQQDTRNTELAAAVVAEERTVLAIVGRTNRAALLRGGRSGPGEVRCYPNRMAATAELSVAAQPGDAILYENDLPDHYA